MKLWVACAAALAGLAVVPARAGPAASIRLNQLGELPDGPKIAVEPNASGEPVDWKLIDRDGRI
ncbi:MAG TPA: cellulase N-terminal Ig-like domain-containing protein, partial [Sphingomicrobium sp.]|nr:cellulase N-terminal Ig-like domain-containing protein [Sphingomicrobium sp.]